MNNYKKPCSYWKSPEFAILVTGIMLLFYMAYLVGSAPTTDLIFR